MKWLLVTVCLFGITFAGSFCPKESEWHDGECFGSVSVKENDNQFHAEFLEVDDSCCTCPPLKELYFDDNEDKCYTVSAWFHDRIYVGDHCCKSDHFERKSAREYIHKNDKAKKHFEEVEGSGFFLPPPPPSSTGRGLLSFSTGRNLLTANANGLCPAFYKAWAGYPPYDSVPSTELRSKVGFGEWVTNTCAVRGTLSVMNMGLNPGKIGYTKWRAKGKRYLIRVLEMEQFLLATFGKPYAVGGAGVRTNRLDEQRNRVYDENPAIKGKAGIVRYSDCGWSDATGHIDVWDGTNIRGHTYASKCKKIEVWNVCNPVSNPNYAKFIAYLKKTKATYHN